SRHTSIGSVRTEKLQHARCLLRSPEFCKGRAQHRAPALWLIGHRPRRCRCRRWLCSWLTTKGKEGLFPVKNFRSNEIRTADRWSPDALRSPLIASGRPTADPAQEPTSYSSSELHGKIDQAQHRCGHTFGKLCAHRRFRLLS